MPCLIGMGLFIVSGFVAALLGSISFNFRFWDYDSDCIPFVVFNGWFCGFMSLILDSTYHFGFVLSALMAIAISGVILVFVAVVNWCLAQMEDGKEDWQRKNLESQWKKFCIGKDGAASLRQMYARYRQELNLRYGGRNQMKYISCSKDKVWVADEYLAEKSKKETHALLLYHHSGDHDFFTPEKSYGEFNTTLLTNGRGVDLSIRFYPDGTFQLDCDGEKVCVNSWDECVRYLDAKNEA